MALQGLTGGIAGGATVSIIIKAIDNYSKEFNKLDKSIQKQQTGLSKLGFFLKKSGLGYAALAYAAAGFGFKAVTTAVESERAMQQYSLSVGEAADVMLTDMRKASKGMVSDLNLVQSTTRAMALGISKDMIPKLLEVATARAKMFGTTTTKAFDDIAIGVGRQSRMILDNLGIILDLDKTYQDYADTLGITVGELTEFDKKMALTKSIIQSSEGVVKAQNFITKTWSERLQLVTAQAENVLAVVGKLILKEAEDFFQITAMNDARETQFDLMIGIEGAYKTVARKVVALSEAETELTANLKSSNQEAENLIDSLLNLNDVMFEGERSKSLDITKQKETIRLLKLRELSGEDVAETLEHEEDVLARLRLEHEGFDNQRAIESAKNAVRLENAGELEATNYDDFVSQQDRKFTLLDEERDKQENLREKIIDVQDAGDKLLDVFIENQDEKTKSYETELDNIDQLIHEVNKLADAYQNAKEIAEEKKAEKKKNTSLFDVAKAFVKHSFTNSLGKIIGVGDAILRPNGDVVKTHPNDTIIATKNPGGMGGLTINIGTVNGLSGRDIARALETELQNKITLG